MLTVKVTIDGSTRESVVRALDIVRRQLADGLQDGAGANTTSSFSFTVTGEEAGVAEEAKA